MARRGRSWVPESRSRSRSWRLTREDVRLAAIFFMGYFFPPILPALPALRRTFSPAYRTPLPL